MSPEDMQAILTAKQVTVLRNHKDTVPINLPKDFIFQANDEAQNGGKPFMDYRWPVVVSQTLLNQGGEKAWLKEGDRMVAVQCPTPAISSSLPNAERTRAKTSHCNHA